MLLLELSHRHLLDPTIDVVRVRWLGWLLLGLSWSNLSLGIASTLGRGLLHVDTTLCSQCLVTSPDGDHRIDLGQLGLELVNVLLDLRIHRIKLLDLFRILDARLDRPVAPTLGALLGRRRLCDQRRLLDDRMHALSGRVHLLTDMVRWGLGRKDSPRALGKGLDGAGRMGLDGAGRMGLDGAGRNDQVNDARHWAGRLLLMKLD